MARDNRGDRGAMLVLASLLVVFSLAVIGVNPAVAYYIDTDGDGLPDFYEIKHALLLGDGTDEGPDWDDDGLNDIVEDTNSNGIVDVGETDPYNWDTDGDGIGDGIENPLTDLNRDTDGDGLINALDWDSDADFIPDTVEELVQPPATERDGVWEGVGSNETNWLVADTDGDGLIDGWEHMWGSDPQLANTDGDGWDDGQEVFDYGTDPTDDDTDNDGRLDGIGNEDWQDDDSDGMNNAVDYDSDNDGLDDSDEDANENGIVDTGETNPRLYDTDADGFSDGYEIYEAISDPLDGGVDTDGDGWVDGLELVIWKTNPLMPDGPDTDQDGLGDEVENPLATPGVDSDGDGLIDALDLDSDNDGISDAEEIVVGVDGYVTDPTLVDTDGDGLPDNAEIMIFGTDPTSASSPSDGDPIDPGDEIYNYQTNFDMADTDEDGVDEGVSAGTDRANANTDGGYAKPFGDSSNNALDIDSDGDGLLDGEEFAGTTNMVLKDTDSDGLLDGEEVHIWGTNPADADSDDDGLNDGAEVNTHGTDPLDNDTDGDTVQDGVEVNSWGSNPLDPDTDGDGILDGETITGTYIDAAGVTQSWSFTEDDSNVEAGEAIPNVLDTDSDWNEYETPTNVAYFHDRTEIAYEDFVTVVVAARGDRFVIGPLNPGNIDTDGDGLSDVDEVACESDPLDARVTVSYSWTPQHSDTDGLWDLEERVIDGTTTPTMHLVNDFDGDGLWDGDELHPSWFDGDANGVTWPPTNSTLAHSEQDYGYPAPFHDGLNDGEEVLAGADGYVTNPHWPDTDGDGIWDDDDNSFFGFAGYDPTNFDVDGDGLYDGYEDANHDGPPVDAGETNPLDGDTDDDGIYDGDEEIFGTDPLDWDSDGDLIRDGWEVGVTVADLVGLPDTDPVPFGAGDLHPASKTDPRLMDSDFDGFDDDEEDADRNGRLDPGETDAQNRDTDGDHLPDFYEVVGNDPAVPPADYYAVGWVDNTLYPTDPTLTDDDGDALEDDLEFEQQTIPIGVVDTDTDGLEDGTEYYGLLGGVTDPSNPDTDNDGCWETETLVSDIEAVDLDTDADGIFNALDVDSDNDWIWDGAGSEDCAGANDGDTDGIPDILDNDSDNDMLSDRQEMGLDTWHTWLDNDQDHDNDGRYDGEEYFQEIHQPHQGEWALGWRPSDPNLPDTDLDGMHDGFEVGVMGPIPPAPPWGPGTNPDPGWWDFEGLANSEPYLYDSDFDGLSDLDEDLNGDGNNADVGFTEPDPMDDDTDNEGLIDGYEFITIMTDVLLCDTDIDDLADGLETGLLSAMGSDTSPANPCLSQRYDTVDDGAYTTDPLNWDTDNDGLLDGGPGEEDEDRDGFRDGNDPHDTVTDWPAGETDPNEWDTDRGGVNDMLDVDPVLYTLGDWDIDIHPNAVGVVFDTLDIDALGAGIPPGSNDTEAFQVVHTTLANNPDPDGPSAAAAPIDTVYFRSTSLHWAGPLWSWPPANYSVPDTGKLDWFHYTTVSFNPPQVENFAVGATQDVDVTVDVPEGAMPGWYFGYLQAETRRPGTNPLFLDPMPQELPDDYTMLRLYVAPQKDIDICDDDDDPIGVGFMSDPHEFPNPPMDGEMHLVGAPMYPGEITGMFRYANPNTNPDGVWPWPGGSPDGINDYNGLPAFPWVNRTWDTDPPDPQGNVNLTYEIEAQYEWLAIGPVNPTTSISFPSPLMPDLELAQVESSLVFIDTTLLPRGLYVGTVIVFEDVHGILIGDPPDGVWQPDETNDTFELQFQLLLPDLDIDDDYANMSGNQLIIDVLPGDVDVMIGEIELWNASMFFDPPSNVDAVDGPGDEDILDLQYYDPTSGDFFYIPQDGSDPKVTVALVDPAAVQTIDVTIDGLMGDGLDQGQAKRLRLQIPAVPADMPAGTYRTDHPGTWIPGDGTIPICARGMATGIGDVTILQPDGAPNDGSEAGLGQGIIYDESISAVAELMDYFHLTVHVIPVIGVGWDDPDWSVEGDPGGVLCDVATVNNTGNVEVTDVHFEASALIGANTGAFIPSIFVGFDPSSMSIPYGGSEDVEICVAIAAGTRADTYEGIASVLADGETLFDELPISVTVNHIPDMDVLDNAYNVVGNVMTLAPEPLGPAASGQFEAANLGNGDLENVQAGITGLPDGVTGNVVILDPLIPWSESRVYAVQVSWTDGTVAADTYPCVVTVSADGRTVTDTFQLDVIIGELLACEFYESSAEGEGFAGETIDVEVTVDNAGNAAIAEGIVFAIDDLVGETGSFIPSDAVTFDPVTAPIPYLGSTDFTLHVAAPDYLLGQDYEGVLNVYLDGVWQDDMTITVTLEMEDGEVAVYPNPYRGAEHDGGVTIKVGRVDNAKISIFDMYGAKVKELTSGSGRDTDAVWDLKNDKDRTVASGMYIVTIDIGDEVVTRKIMVIR